jgi:DNA-binding MarR family transcriptional regulator
MKHTPSGKALTDMILTLLRLNSEIIAEGDRMTKDLRLSSSRWQIVAQVVHSGEMLTVSQIARNMGLHRQTVQPQVDAMADDGLVVFAENPHHRRSKLVHTTPSGRRAYREALRRQVGWANRAVRGVSADSLTQANATLQLLLGRLQTPSSHPLRPASGSAR